MILVSDEDVSIRFGMHKDCLLSAVLWVGGWVSLQASKQAGKAANKPMFKASIKWRQDLVKQSAAPCEVCIFPRGVVSHSE